MEDRQYAAKHLETAACLWEAVLDLKAGNRGGRGMKSEVNRAWDRIGTMAMRLTAVGWTDALDRAWTIADTDAAGQTGEYLHAFDWDFVPEWIDRNIDWTTHTPSIRGAQA